MNRKISIALIVIGVLGLIFSRKDYLSGGLADQLSEKDVDPEQLKMGIEVELEHTNDPEIAKEIALDHLAEHSDYYTRLKAANL